MKAPVLDCSAVCAWLLDDESDSRADAHLEQIAETGALAPALLWAELRNALVVAERRGRIAPEQTLAVLREVDALGLRFDQAPDSPATLALARKHRLTVYDAMYLELATREGCPLISLDRKLRLAAKAEGLDAI